MTQQSAPVFWKGQQFVSLQFKLYYSNKKRQQALQHVPKSMESTEHLCLKKGSNLLVGGFNCMISAHFNQHSSTHQRVLNLLLSTSTETEHLCSLFDNNLLVFSQWCSSSPLQTEFQHSPKCMESTEHVCFLKEGRNLLVCSSNRIIPAHMNQHSGSTHQRGRNNWAHKIH